MTLPAYDGTAIYDDHMPISRRRRRAVIFVIISSLGVGLAALVAAAAGDTERIGSYWISGELTDEGLTVVEVIDYDFGVESRRGIYRNVPDLSLIHI